MPPRRPAGVTAMMMFAAATMLMSGCSSRTTTEPARNRPHDSYAALASTLDAADSALERLARLAEREPAQPFPDSVDIGAHLGLDPIPTTPGERAGLDLSGAIDHWRASEDAASPAAGASAPVTPDDRASALDLLRASRNADLETALRALDEASRLDPTASAVPLERFRRVHAADRRLDATSAAREAFALGERDPEILLALALEFDAGYDDAALSLLELIERGTEFGTEADALARVAGGEALVRRGYAGAGGALLLEGLDTIAAPSAGSPWRRDSIRTLARTDELRALAGDALLAAGEHQAASRAYESDATVSLGSSSAPRRAVHAMLLAGRRAAAASVIVESLAHTPRIPSAFDRDVLTLATRESATLAAIVTDAIVETRNRHAGLGISYQDAMTAIAAEVAPGRAGIELLRDRLRAGPARNRPAESLLRLAAGRKNVVPEAVALTRAQPERARMWAAALLGGRTPPVEIAEVLGRDPSEAARLLLAGVELQRRRPHEAFETLQSFDAEAGAPVDRMIVEAGAESGRWDAVDLALGRLRSNESADPVLVLGALRIAQRLDDAYELGEELISGREQTVDALLEVTELASLRAQAHDAELFLQLASELDRYDERIYAARLMLYSQGGPLPDAEQRIAVLRELRERLPESPLARLHDAGDLASAGLYEEAEAELLAIAEEDPDQNPAFEMLLSVWDAMTDANSDSATDTFSRAETRLASLLDRRPASPAVGAALARVLIRQGQAQEALRVIDRVESSVGASVLAPLRERIMERELGAREDALRHALARLTDPTLSIDDAITRAGLEIQNGTVNDAASTLNAFLPAGITLTPEQRARLTGTVAMAVAALPDDDAEAEPDTATYEHTRAPVARVIRIAGEHTELPEAIIARLLRLKAQDPAATPDVLSSLAEEHATQGEEGRARAYQAVLFELIRARRFADASRTLALGAVARDAFSADLLLAAAEVTGRFGRPDDLRDVIQILDQSGRAPDAAELFWDEQTRRGRPIGSVLAEIAYHAASQAAFTERDDVAEEAYRIALEHDPRHMWSNNDLGYMLADQGRELEAAERMILIAHEIEPDSSNVADSLGWVRYKRGRIEDENGVEGAITLIRRALSLEDGGDRATLHDHLGDALWRAGRHDEAEHAWLDAEEVGLSQVRDARRQRSAEDPTRARFESRLRSIRSKLRAVQAGEEPRVAPLPAEGESP